MTLARHRAVALAACAIVSVLWLEFSFLRLDLSGINEPWTSHPLDNFDWDGKRPLKCVFLTWGSRGDHQPNIALGLELARRGHKVTVTGMHEYRNLIERHPSLNYVEIVDSNLWELAEAFRDSEGADFISLTRDYVIASNREMVPQYIDAARDADVIFGSHSAMLELQHLTVAQHLRKPIIFLTHDMTLPTAEYSFNAGDSRVQDYGRRTNVLNQRIFGIVLGAALTFGPSSDPREFRAGLGLQTPWPFMQVLSPEFLADFPVLETRDPSLWPVPRDRPPHWYNTGYFVTHDEGRETPALQSELQAWIAERRSRGRRVLYFGQGSFSHHAREVFTDILHNTLKELDMDGIALASTVDNRVHPNHIKVVEELNQSLIFPQCEAVVHHGGAGSASQSIRSGRPGVCLPSMPFQEIWGAKIEEYGAGILLKPKEMLRAWEMHRTNLLTAAILAALDGEVQAMAKELGRLAREASELRGVSLAADAAQDHLRRIVQKRQKREQGNLGEL